MIAAASVLLLYTLLYLVIKDTTINSINKIKRNFKYYPKHYCMPSRWMRKHFKLPKREIPKFLCFRLYESAACIALIPVMFFVLLFTQFNEYVASGIIFVSAMFFLLDQIVWLILSSIFEKT